ncbi:hypothetical protein H4R35_000526 [Dimargaris xerosporica]|nr:hypothetical protein H4R35_000526 [Dimargaris xerosporica]
MACPPNASDTNARVSTKALFRIRDPSVLRSPVPRLPVASNDSRASSLTIGRTSAAVLSRSGTPSSTWRSGSYARPSAFAPSSAVATPPTVLQSPALGLGRPTFPLLTPQSDRMRGDLRVTRTALDSAPIMPDQPSTAPLIRPTAHTPCLGQVLQPLPIATLTVSTKPRSLSPGAPLSVPKQPTHETAKQRSAIRSYPTPQSEKPALTPCRPAPSLLTQSVQPKAARPSLDCRRSVDPLLWPSQPTIVHDAPARLANLVDAYGHFDVCLAKWWVRVDTASGAAGVVVEGERILPNGPVCTWKSSFVADRLAANKIRTINGKVYLLDGECNIARMQTFGYSARKIKLFLNGFPETWQSILPPDSAKHLLVSAPVHLPTTRSQTPPSSTSAHAQTKHSDLPPIVDSVAPLVMSVDEPALVDSTLHSEPSEHSALAVACPMIFSEANSSNSGARTPAANARSPQVDLPNQCAAGAKRLTSPPKSTPAPRRSRRILQRTAHAKAASASLPGKIRSERSTWTALPVSGTPSPAPVLKFVWGQSEPMVQVAGCYVPFSSYAAHDNSPSMVTRAKRKRHVWPPESACVNEQMLSPMGTKAGCRRITRTSLAEKPMSAQSSSAKKASASPSPPPLSPRPTHTGELQPPASCNQELLVTLDPAATPKGLTKSSVGSEDEGDIQWTPLSHLPSQSSAAGFPTPKQITTQTLYQRVAPGPGAGRWRNPHIAVEQASEPSWVTSTTYDLSD